MATSRARVSVLLAVTFLAGMAAGVAADRQIGARTEAGGESVGHTDPTRPGGSAIERFADELGLSERQRSEIAPIVEDTRERMMQLFEPVRPEYGAIVDSARARIEAILTPGQVDDYRVLLEREYGVGHMRGGDPD